MIKLPLEFLSEQKYCLKVLGVAAKAWLEFTTSYRLQIFLVMAATEQSDEFKGDALLGCVSLQPRSQ